MSSTMEPDSTAITEENIASNQQIVRLQGGGLRFLDAHAIQEKNFGVVTRPFQNDTTQHWKLTRLSGEIHTIVQVSSGRYLDAVGRGKRLFAVTRPQENNDSQRWRIPDFGGGWCTIQQVSSGKYLTATFEDDFRVRLTPELEQQSEWRRGEP